MTIQYTAPVWTALTAALVLGERVRPVVAAGASVSMAGVVLVARPSVLFGEGLALDPAGVGAVAAAAVLSGLAYTFVRKLRQTDRPMTIIFYLSWIGMVGALPFAFLGGWAMPTGPQWLLLLGIGLATHAGQVGLTKGMQTLEAGTASAIGYVQVVLAFVWGAVFLGDAVDAPERGRRGAGGVERAAGRPASAGAVGRGAGGRHAPPARASIAPTASSLSGRSGCPAHE